MSGATLDMAGALAVTGAHGVPAQVAAELLTAFARGLMVGQAERRDDHDQDHDQRRDAADPG